jgi:hypothetical protein
MLITAFADPNISGFIMWGFWDGANFAGAKSPVYDKEWNLKPAGEQIVDLLYNKWWTRDAKAVSAGDGKATVRGFYGDYDVHVSKSMSHKVMRNKFAVCLEAGYTIYNNHRNYTGMRNRHVLCRLSGYFECGINPLIQNRDVREMYTLNPSNPAELMNVPYYLSNSTRNKRTIPFMVGIRWTYTLATITCRTCR